MSEQNKQIPIDHLSEESVTTAFINTKAIKLSFHYDQPRPCVRFFIEDEDEFLLIRNQIERLRLGLTN